MRRDQLEHAIRTACQIIGHQDVIVVGSQAIRGTFREEDLPAAATMSIEANGRPKLTPKRSRATNPPQSKRSSAPPVVQEK